MDDIYAILSGPGDWTLTEDCRGSRAPESASPSRGCRALHGAALPVKYASEPPPNAESMVSMYAERHESGLDLWSGKPRDVEIPRADRAQGRRLRVCDPPRWWEGARARCLCGRAIRLRSDGRIRGHGSHSGDACPGAGTAPIYFQCNLYAVKRSPLADVPGWAA